ncbi:MAG: 16S rRNA (cytidine(1402)-2'-O)-methyltransferase [Anaerolineae bacterium]
MGTLYLVTTPIGNLEDITLRALRILQEVDLIAAEDTRQTRKLLDRHGITTPTTSYFEHNKLAKLDRILDALSGGDLAIVSEAGTPGISDPGLELVRSAVEAGVEVVPVPGPSAITAALAASGLPTDRFVYLGFLPRKKGERRHRLEWAAALDCTLVAFEAPHRLLASLADIREVLGNRQIVAAREITKRHEEIFRGSVSEVLARFEEHAPRGELTLVIAGAETVSWSTEQVLGALAALREDGLSGKEASVEVARSSGWSRSKVYDLWLQSRAEAAHGSR